MDRAASHFTAFRGIEMNKQTWAVAAQAMASGLRRLPGRGLRCASLSVTLLATILPFSAQAQNAIQAVSGSVQGGAEVIRIDLARPLASVPGGFTIQTPARIALDFPGVSNSVGRSAVELNLGNLRSANVVQVGERTRVVLNFKSRSEEHTSELQSQSNLVCRLLL